MPKKTYRKKYMVGDVVVPGVTTIIKTSLGWGMNALIGWAVKVTKEGKDHRKVMQEAADAGTLAHTLCEHHAKGTLVTPEEYDGYDEKQKQSAINAMNAFLMWLQGSKLNITQSELEVIHRGYMYGGTIDLVLKDDKGDIHICDIKTTNYMLPDHLIQLAAYAYAYEDWQTQTLTQDNTGKVVAAHLLRFGKGEETVFHHTMWNRSALEYGFDAFLSLRDLFDLKPRIEGLL